MRWTLGPAWRSEPVLVVPAVAGPVMKPLDRARAAAAIEDLPRPVYDYDPLATPSGYVNSGERWD